MSSSSSSYPMSKIEIQYSERDQIEASESIQLLDKDIDERPKLSSFEREWNLFLEATWGGMGLFSTSYFLFSIGILVALWKEVFPQCFEEFAEPDNRCDPNIIDSYVYAQIMALMVGMLLFGFLPCDYRWSGIWTTGLMLVGSMMQTFSWVWNPMGDAEGTLIMFEAGFLIFAIGAGGEYPVSAFTNAARSEEQEKRDTDQRGRRMLYTFSMQGWGYLVCTLAFLGAGSMKPEVGWRVVYGIGTFFVFFSFIKRVKIMANSEKKILGEGRKKMCCLFGGTEEEGGGASGGEKKTGMGFAGFEGRLFATASCWFLWDVAHYGNRLFQTTIIEQILGPDTPLKKTLLFTVGNAACGLIGLYLAVFLVEWGRWRLQCFGFLSMGVVFFLCAFVDQIQSEAVVYATLYFLTTLCGQFGPNATTYLLPAEIFPREIRMKGHGFSAFCGKAGALLATLLFSFFKSESEFIFFVSGVCGALALIITFFFIPEVKELKLSEVDELGKCEDCQARKKEYLSYFERYLKKRE